ncbi:MAG: c-type cytochrome [Sulfurimonas sp.]|nr:c-type cytochrome [Sulfurimonas sp.]MDQ7059933.1 c-type cytochrome [Sulfurimonas sp.]
MNILLAILLLSGFVYAGGSKFDTGEKIYKQTCVSCHGVDGSANTGISFIVNPRNLNRTILTEEQSYQIIKKGAHFNGASADIMPSFESVFNEEELRSVTGYITKNFNTESEQRVKKLMDESAKIDPAKKAKMLKRGKKIYGRNCSWCHGVIADGNGDATRNPEMSIFPYNLNKSLLSKDQMFLYSKHGGKFWGTAKNDMPSWSKKYDDYTLHSVVMYVKEVLGAKNETDK